MPVTIARANAVATVKLNRPEAANALSRNLLNELQAAFQALAQDASISVIIITGAGDKAFCAGADLKERKTMTDEESLQTIALINRVIQTVEQLPQPVIAVLNGVAYGGGLELALACDFRIACRTAKLGLTETSLGIIPGAGGTQRLTRLIGIGRAKELIFTAKRITAIEALTYGIVEHVVEQSELEAFTASLAQAIAKNAPLSLRQAKKAINLGCDVDLQTGLQIESLCYQQLITTEDRQEGLQAFSEKRPPVYRGR